MKPMEREGAVTELVETWVNLFKQSARLGVDVFRSMTPSVSSVTSQLTSAASRLPKATHGCSCTIPPACWLPVDAGHVLTSACADTKATLKIRVSNCGPTARTVKIEPSSAAVGGVSPVTISPQSLTIPPMEDATSTVTVNVAHGDAQQYMIWVRGCENHFVRWTVTPGNRCDDTSTVTVEDCPDTVHHWYDHFYCQHPCRS